MTTAPSVPGPRRDRIERDFDELAQIVDDTADGWTRTAFTPPHAAAKRWLGDKLQAAGLAVARDAACNVIGTRPGRTGRVLATGSHIDTVPGGGRFDGIAGVLAAVEVARCLHDADVRLDHELRIVEFTGEEANDFGLSCVGSRAIAGKLAPDDLALRDEDGTTLADALCDLGGRPDDIADARWGQVAAFVELHIEQGPVLERAGSPVGLVSGIVGIHRAIVTVTGRPDHAGTTPMDHRRDALCAAAELVLLVEQLAADGDGVATTGRISSRPGAANVVPGDAELLIEYRSTDPQWLEDVTGRLADGADRVADRRGVAADVRPISATRPAAVDAQVVTALEHAVADLELTHRVLPSGAGHDAAFMAELGPMGMIFVPSLHGRSHCPEEWTDLDDLTRGADVLLRGLLRLDETLGADADLA